MEGKPPPMGAPRDRSQDSRKLFCQIDAPARLTVRDRIDIHFRMHINSVLILLYPYSSKLFINTNTNQIFYNPP